MQLNFFIITLTLLCTQLLNAEQRPAEKIFNRWIQIQKIFTHTPITSMSKKIDATYIKAVEKTKSLNKELLPPVDYIYRSIAGNLNTETKTFSDKKLELLYHAMEHDVAAFVEQIKQPFIKAFPLEEPFNLSEFIEQSKLLNYLLFAHTKLEPITKLTHSAGTNFFDFFFRTENFKKAQELLLDRSYHPALKYLYATMWYELAGNGWKYWHEDCLNDLKKEADAGKRIVYLAGGSDVYQLLKKGIHNITVIDPQLPSQPKYYTNDWQFLIATPTKNNGLGDEVTLTDDCGKTITLRRTTCEKKDAWSYVQLANGSLAEIPESVTEWTIFDESENKLGVYRIERKLLTQEDFKTSDDKVFLLSFNELYFICLPKLPPRLNGWGVLPCQFSKDMKIYIKQLPRPVNKEEMCNIRTTTLINTSDFEFIALGTCVN